MPKLGDKNRARRGKYVNRALIRETPYSGPFNWLWDINVARFYSDQSYISHYSLVKGEI